MQTLDRPKNCARLFSEMGHLVGSKGNLPSLLKKALPSAEMEPLADGPRRLATHLRALHQRLDMEAILNVLEQVQSR